MVVELGNRTGGKCSVPTTHKHTHMYVYEVKKKKKRKKIFV